MMSGEKARAETASSARTASIVERQRAFFNSGATRSVAFRKAQLVKLRGAILAHERDILEAVKADLGKSDFEAFTTEIVLVLGEIMLMLKRISRWARTERRGAGIFNFPGSARAIRDPHGVCLVMSPWNYPFQLSVMPLVGAIAAGNTAILKPSAYSAATSALVSRMIRETFPEEYLACVEGGRDMNQDLLSQRFDFIFFTGSVEVGKLVMERAAKNLTPVTLELGGKSPCIIDRSANIDLSARRAVWGKCINAGQTCVAPDYFLVHESVREAFIARARFYVEKFYGADPHQNPEFPHIINRRHFDRLSALIAGAEKANPRARLVSGGRTDPDAFRIEPAIVDGVDWDDPLMGEELFGPIIPIISWKDENEIVERILARPRPLALYIFTRSRAQANRIMGRVPFGGGCVNDAIMHVATHSVPFGGTGASGMGSYHGKASFDTFSRVKSVIDKPLIADVPLRYPPFAGKYRAFRKFL
jgi:aldehyde dehydrogenase (NAD+)